MRKIIGKILKFIIIVLNAIIPKFENKILFHSVPDFSDNAQAFYEFISKDKKYDCIWIVKDYNILNILKDKGIKAFKVNSIGFLFTLVTSKYIVSSHNGFLHLKTKRQTYISLWHGMPLKRINCLEENFSKEMKKTLKKIDYTIATSNIMKLAMSCAKIH